MDVTNSRTC